MVEGVPVEIRANMKYLGLVLDSRWQFKEHFGCLVPRVRAATNLCHLMSNLREPGDGPRRLYAGAVRSMMLYGAPV